MLRAKYTSSFTVSGNPHKGSTYAMLSSCSTVSFLVQELTRGDLLSYVVGDWTLPALPTEPLVGRRVSTDGQPEGLRLPAIFVHPSLQTDDKRLDSAATSRA